MTRRDPLPIGPIAALRLHVLAWADQYPAVAWAFLVATAFGAYLLLSALFGGARPETAVPAEPPEPPFVSGDSESPACGPGADLAPPTADPPQPFGTDAGWPSADVPDDDASPLARREIARAVPAGPSLGKVLDAIRMEESGGRASPPDGDSGRAIGPFQIWRSYWTDARMTDGEYEDCRDEPYARRVVVAYWRRWCPEALARVEARVLARTHKGGGPRGAANPRTLAYARRIERRLQGL